MTPLEHINEWLDQQSQEAQSEIALHVLLFVEPSMDAFSEDRFEKLRAWLNISNPETVWLSIGRVLSFKAIMDHTLHDMISGKTWARNEALFKDVIERGRGEPDSVHATMVPQAQGFLDNLPNRKEFWSKIIRGWQELSNSALTHDSLDRWSLSAMRRI